MKESKDVPKDCAKMIKTLRDSQSIFCYKVGIVWRKVPICGVEPILFTTNRLWQADVFPLLELYRSC